MIIAKAHEKGNYDDIVRYEFADMDSLRNFFSSFRGVLIVTEVITIKG